VPIQYYFNNQTIFMNKHRPAISPGHDAWPQVLAADPNVQAKAKQIVLWIPDNIEKLARTGNIAYGGLNICGGFMRAFTGICEFRSNFCELTKQERIIFCSVVLVNIITVVGGTLCCFQSKVFNNYNAFILILNNARGIISKYYPMLFSRGEARLRLMKVFALSGAGSDGKDVSEVYLDNNAVLKTNAFGKIISVIPVVGSPLLSLISKTCFCISFLFLGVEVSKNVALLKETQAPVVNRRITGGSNKLIKLEGSDTIVLDRKGRTLGTGPKRLTLTFETNKIIEL
jgi:hypothetical protein